jgi:hypothetical protein
MCPDSFLFRYFLFGILQGVGGMSIEDQIQEKSHKGFHVCTNQGSFLINNELKIN